MPLCLGSFSPSCTSSTSGHRHWLVLAEERLGCDPGLSPADRALGAWQTILLDVAADATLVVASVATGCRRPGNLSAAAICHTNSAVILAGHPPYFAPLAGAIDSLFRRASSSSGTDSLGSITRPLLTGASALRRLPPARSSRAALAAVVGRCVFNSLCRVSSLELDAAPKQWVFIITNDIPYPSRLGNRYRGVLTCILILILRHLDEYEAYCHLPLS